MRHNHGCLTEDCQLESWHLDLRRDECVEPGSNCDICLVETIPRVVIPNLGEGFDVRICKTCLLKALDILDET